MSFPLIIIACFEESWQFPDEYSPGNIEVMAWVKYLDQVVTDNKFVPLFLCPGAGRDDVAWAF
ncbi:unnamed protein product [marine sediment metagenome]|uniref:Uncharacterized protein n=1 Tax=marine sediment metagenome TaxID=412755 RepID=X1QZG9_9ZZZZ